MKKPTSAWDAACLTLRPVSDGWKAAQTKLAQAQLGDILQWSAAPVVQACAWLNSIHCSANESAKRLMAIATDRCSQPCSEQDSPVEGLAKT